MRQARDRAERNRRELSRAARSNSTAEGHTFRSETDAEVCDLLERIRGRPRRRSPKLPELEGHFTIVAIHHDHPDVLAGVRRHTPLAGGHRTATFIASASRTSCARIRRRVQVDNGEVIAVTPKACAFSRSASRSSTAPINELDWDDETAEKGGYETFMVEEIDEQPEAVRETIGDRVRGHELVLESRLDGDGGPQPAADRDRRVRDVLSRGRRRPRIIEEWSASRSSPTSRAMDRLKPGAPEGHPRHRRCRSPGSRHTVNAIKLARERRKNARDHEPDGHADHARGRDGCYTWCGIESASRRRRRSPRGSTARLARAELASRRRCRPRAISTSSSTSSTTLPDKLARSSTTRCRTTGSTNRAAFLRPAVLPLPRPPHRLPVASRVR